MAHFLEKQRKFQCARDLAQPVERSGEVAVAVPLDGLLQRIGVHRKRIGANSFQRIRDVVNGGRGQLVLIQCCRDSGISGAMSRTVKLDAARSPNALSKHDPLRSEHHADTQPLRGGQISVGRRQFGTPGHRADQNRRPERAPRKFVDRSMWARLVWVSALYGRR